MVKLEGLTRGEIERIENKRKSDESWREFMKLENRFIKIAEEMFDIPPFLGLTKSEKRVSFDSYANNFGATYYLRILSHPGDGFTATIERKDIKLDISSSIYVHDPSKNRMSIPNPTYLEDALKLARAYEEAGLGEFTIKKQYEE